MIHWTGMVAITAMMGGLWATPNGAEAKETSSSASVASYESPDNGHIDTKYTVTVTDGLYDPLRGGFAWTDSPTIVNAASVHDKGTGWKLVLKSAVPLSNRDETIARDAFFVVAQKSYKTSGGLKGAVGLKEVYLPHKEGGTHAQFIYANTNYKISDDFSLYGTGYITPFGTLGAGAKVGPKFSHKMAMGANVAITGHIGGTWVEDAPDIINFTMLGGSAQLSQKANERVSGFVGGLVNYDSTKDLMDSVVNLGLTYLF